MGFPTITTHDAGGLTQTVNTMPDAGQKTKAESLGVVWASDSDPLPVQPTYASATALTPASSLGAATPVSMAAYGSVNAQVDGLSGGDTITLYGSTTQAGTYYAFQVMALSGTFGTITATVAATGVFAGLGLGRLWVKAVQTGSASTPTITLSAGQ